MIKNENNYMKFLYEAISTGRGSGTKICLAVEADAPDVLCFRLKSMISLRKSNTRKKILAPAIDGPERAGFSELLGNSSWGVLGGLVCASSQSANPPRPHRVESDEVVNKF